jgi:hypothetical protein
MSNTQLPPGPDGWRAPGILPAAASLIQYRLVKPNFLAISAAFAGRLVIPRTRRQL